MLYASCLLSLCVSAFDVLRIYIRKDMIIPKWGCRAGHLAAIIGASGKQV